MSKLIKKVSITVVSIATVLSLSGAAGLIPTVNAAGLTSDQITRIISLLEGFGVDATTIANVQTSLSGGTPATSNSGTSSISVPASLLSSSDLTVGSKGAAVMDLQKFLNANGYTVAASGAGSLGNESTYFGNATKAALAKWQAAMGITPASGYFGKVSRAKLSAMAAATTSGSGTTTTTGTTVATGAPLSAVLASAQPTGTLAPKNAARVPFTTITLTAGSSDVTVNSLTVQRNGVAMDAAFAGIVLVDDAGLQIGDAKTLNSNHQANIGNPFIIKAGSSKTVTVAANMAADLSAYDGQVASFSVVAINTADNSVFTGLPLSGISLRLVNNITLGTVTTAVSSYDPASANSQQIGTTGYKFAALRITAGSAEKVKLMSIRFNQSGSVSSSDLANLQVMVDGTGYAVAMDSTGKYFTATFGSGILIDKGLSKDVWIQGDIIGTNATNRTIQFDIYKPTDVYMIGDTYGYGIIPSAGSGTYDSTHATSQLTTSNPWFQSARITIAAGSATAVSKALSVPAQNIAVNVPNQILGGFDTDIKGEALSVQTMKFTIASSSGSGTGLLTSVSLYQGSTVVAGPVDAVYTGATTQTVTFSDTVTIPVGKTTYTIKGNVASGIGNGTQYAVTTNPSTDWTNVTGAITGNAISLSSIGTLTMNTMTVKGAALAVYVSPTPAAQIVVANKQNHTFATIQLDASQSGEDIRLSVIPLYSTGTTTDMTSCQLFDGATALTTGSNVWTADTLATGSTKHSFTLDNALTIAKGTIKNISVVCNLKAGLNVGNVYKWGISGNIANDWSAVTGVTSGTTVTVTGTTNDGNAMTIGASALTAATDSSSPAFALVYGGQTGVTMGVVKFHASSEAMTIKEIALQLTNAASSTSADLVRATLFDGTNPVGTVTFSGDTKIASTTKDMNGGNLAINVPADSDKLLTIKVDMGSIGVGLAGHEGAVVAVDLKNAVADKTQSGGDIYATGVPSAFNGVKLYKSYPSIAGLTGAATAFTFNTAQTYALMKFSITAVGGDMLLNKLTIGVATSSTDLLASTTLTSLQVFGYSDAAMTQPLSNYTNGQVVNTITALPSKGNVTAAITDGMLKINSGNTVYFKVLGTITSTTNAVTNTNSVKSGQVYVRLVPDLGVPSLAGLMGTAADVATSNFVWSPMASTTVDTNSVDWNNGYKVVGLDFFPDTSVGTTTINVQ